MNDVEEALKMMRAEAKIHDAPERRMIDQALDAERERCALIAETLAMSYETRAKQYRKDGEMHTRSLWPPFKKTTYVIPGIERSAKALDAAAAGLRIVVLGCRAGWNPRPDENERIDDYALGPDPLHGLNAPRPDWRCNYDKVKIDLHETPDETIARADFNELG